MKDLFLQEKKGDLHHHFGDTFCFGGAIFNVVG